MYEFAYNEVIEESHQTLRARERAAMDRVIGMLRLAQEKGSHRASEWTLCSTFAVCGRSFINDLKDPNNELSGELEPESSDRHLDDEGDRSGPRRNDHDLTPIIEINELIRDGLK